MRTAAWLCVPLAVMCGACADMAMPVTAPGPVSPVTVLMGGGDASGTPVRLTPARPAPGRIYICRLGRTDAVPAIVVVDGRIVEKDEMARTNLDPDDIVSVEIMKGTAAVERYGQIAAGKGVVLITTRARRGR
jgi:hypothetical protein